jgi:drug/metabolite transporter (DMT)-like permease
MEERMSDSKKRPFVVTVLAVLAGVLAAISLYYAFRSLHLTSFVNANLWNAFMWGLLAYIYVWLVQMLWKVDPQAWMFLAVITTINLIFDFMAMAGSAGWTDVSVSFILNGLILIYVLLPGTRKAFGTQVVKK